MSLTQDQVSSWTSAGSPNAPANAPTQRPQGGAAAPPTILFLGPADPSLRQAMEENFNVIWAPAIAPIADLLPDQIRSIRGVAMGSHCTVDSALIASLENLEIISNFGMTVDTIDLAAAAARRVVVAHTPGVVEAEIADFALGLVLAAVREIPQAQEFLRSGSWVNGPRAPSVGSLVGRRVGLAGYGPIGHAIARRLSGFDVALHYFAEQAEPAALGRWHPTLMGLANAVDTLIVLLPATAAYAGVINRQVLSAMGPAGVVVSISKGSVLDEPHLIEALKTKTTLAAALDSFVDEPYINPGWREVPHALLTPRVSSSSQRARNAIGDLVVSNLLSWFSAGTCVTGTFESR